MATLVPIAAPAGADDEPAPVVPTTPVLSARRLPGVLQGAVADPVLANELDPYLDRAAGDSARSCSTGDGWPTAATRRRQVPASVLKLLTGTAALEVLGADTRLATVAGASSAMADGVVDGDLYVVGGGDPLLTTPGLPGQPRRSRPGGRAASPTWPTPWWRRV